MRISCPKCAYEPRSYDRWSCLCGTIWNTFDTAGRCPGCGDVWRQTQCPACHVWSPHHDWYHDLPAVEWMEQAEEGVKAG